MPLYPWKCVCGHVFEIMRKSMSESNVPPEACPECGFKDGFQRQIAEQGKFILKGDGWHHTEYTRTGRPIK